MLTDNHGKTALDLANEFKKSTCIKLLTKGMDKAQKHNRKALKRKAKHGQAVSMNNMLRDTEGASPEELNRSYSSVNRSKRPDSARGKNLTETEKIQVIWLSDSL